MRAWWWIAALGLAGCDDGEAIALPDGGVARDAAADMLQSADMARDAAPVDADVDATPVDAHLDADVDAGIDAMADAALIDAAMLDAMPDAAPPVDPCGENVWPEQDLVRAGRFVRFTPPGGDIAQRRVTVYLPADYDVTDARYPVFYMHDGQNLFDPRESAFGQDWAVDDAIEGLADAIEPIIVVGVDNSGARRIIDYTPSVDPGRETGGGADAYGRYLVERLKPYIDATFRTQCDRTGVGGSSLGGLVSMHLWLEYPEVFERVAVVSPSFWWNERETLDRLAIEWPEGARVWIDGGGGEGDDPDGDGRSSVIEDCRDVVERLIEGGAPYPAGLGYHEDPPAQHNEPAWRARLPQILRYLYGPPLGDPQALAIRGWSQTVRAGVPFPLSVDAVWPGVTLTLPHAAPEWIGARVEEGALIAEPGGVAVTATWRGRMAGFEAFVRAPAAVEFRVRVPEQPVAEAVFLAGSTPELGTWDPAGVALVRDGDAWTTTVPMAPGTRFAFKITRGSWDTVEKGPNGEEIADRMGVAGDGVIAVDVARWADSR